MTTAVVPMKLGDIFDRFFKLIGKTWLRNLVIGSVVLLPATILFAAGMDSFFSSLTDLLQQREFGGEFHPSEFLEIIGTLVWLALTSIVFTLGTYGATLAATIVGCSEMLGRPITWQDALGKGFGVRFLRLIGMFLLEILIFGALFLLPYGLIIAGITAESVALGLFGGLFFFAAMAFLVFLAISWAFTVPAIAWEEAGVIDAFKRSWNLVQGNWWRVFGILILMSIIVSFAVSILLTPLYFIVLWDFFVGYFQMLTRLGTGDPPDLSTFADMFQNFGVGVGLLSGISTILQVLVAPLYTVVLYFDLRARKGELAQPASPAPAGA